jgi:Tfp pilus assembly protein PilV
MTLIEIVAGVFMSAIMLAVLILIVKLIRDTRKTMKNKGNNRD